MIEALGYYDKTNTDIYMFDPFLIAKQSGLESSINSAENMLEKVTKLPKTKEGVALAAAFALWGNRMDLSIWPADAENSSLDVFAEILHAADENLLHDDTEKLTEYCDMLREKGGGMM